MVEHDLAKVGAAGSSPVSRFCYALIFRAFFAFTVKLSLVLKKRHCGFDRIRGKVEWRQIIALIGLLNADIVVAENESMSLGQVVAPHVFLAVAGVMITGVLMA